MDQNEIDLDWSRWVAEDIADELIAGKVLAQANLERAVAIAAQMIFTFTSSLAIVPTARTGAINVTMRRWLMIA